VHKSSHHIKLGISQVTTLQRNTVTKYSKISLERKKRGQRERKPAHMSFGKKSLWANAIFDALFSAGDSLFFSLLAIYSKNAVKNELNNNNNNKIKKHKIASAKIKGFERFSIAIIRFF